MGSAESKPASTTLDLAGEKGANWRYKLYYDPDVYPSECRHELEVHSFASRDFNNCLLCDSIGHHNRFIGYIIEAKGLKKKMANLIDSKEQILEIMMYKKPLMAWQLTDFILHHLFIVFRTQSKWWSIEKNSEGLTIQGCQESNDNCVAVRDQYRQSPRVGNFKKKLTKLKSAKGKRTVQELIDWLDEERWLYREYNWLSSNCQHFGKAVFNFVAENPQYLEEEMPSMDRPSIQEGEREKLDFDSWDILL
jgi:hypothetical protein